MVGREEEKEEENGKGSKVSLTIDESFLCFSDGQTHSTLGRGALKLNEIKKKIEKGAKKGFRGRKKSKQNMNKSRSRQKKEGNRNKKRIILDPGETTQFYR